MQVRVLSGVPTIAVIAQLAERLICNQDVRGSIPRGGTNNAASDYPYAKHPFVGQLMSSEPAPLQEITVDIPIESVYIDCIW